MLLEHLDEHSRVEYLLSSTEADPAQGRLSSDSPVGRAILGHRSGDLVNAQAPQRLRHLRVARVRVPR